MMADIPVMVLFGQKAMNNFSLKEGQKDDTFEKFLDYFWAQSWNEDCENVTATVSNTRNRSHDRFNLKTTVYLAMKVLKTDDLWVIYLKPVKSSSIPLKKCF